MSETPFAPQNDTIILENPETQNFASFIFGNALHCDQVVEPRSMEGKTVVICGAGPSLRDTAEKWVPKGDQVWGCNSAAIWLYDHGHKVTHAFTVDQTPQLLAEWITAPDIEYLLASTVHPHTTEYLIEKGRRITWFHNFVGVKGPPVAYTACLDCNWMGDSGATACDECQSKNVHDGKTSYEEWLYTALYPATVVVGSGLNATTRAIDLALFMGFDKIIVLGADCALKTLAPPIKARTGSPEHLEWLRNHTIMHADGGHALASDQSSLTLEATIDGRFWLTKPDLIVTASWLVRMKRKFGSRISIMGDTLPRALMGKSEAWLNRLPTLTNKEGQAIEFCLPDYLLDPPTSNKALATPVASP